MYIHLFAFVIFLNEIFFNVKCMNHFSVALYMYCQIVLQKLLLVNLSIEFNCCMYFSLCFENNVLKEVECCVH